ncbi:fibronectin type III domain-containing protein [Jidongwangia harbinensis]|uniref:fibronectin type III domain-containing protein n=1 Tax=Jidongwangia harbinensis TaxID=2878561 RepID=UPI001CD97A96|nr:fibronectin type III domain-containing protein [Jidongwangia harbinensis]MCA2217945.1 fibronectin type III domain-containing protein [Jidongwangia harbinensis]
MVTWTRTMRAQHRGRLPLVVLLAVCLVAATAAVSGAGTDFTGLRFNQIGHWFTSPGTDSVVHVNDTTRTVDARVRVTGLEPDSEVVEGEISGYVVGRKSVRRFDKSSLAVEQTLRPPADERPVAVEARGGPYLVYREAGAVVRLGGEPATIRAGGPLGPPAAAPDGTLWLHRTDAGLLCHLAPDADQVSCSARTPDGHAGALTVVGDTVAFLDTVADTLTPLDGSARLGRPRSVGVDLPATAQAAVSDLDGRIAVLDPGTRRLHLLDGSGLGTDRAAAAPLGVRLPAGRYAAPAAGRSSVALLEVGRGQLHTFDSAGRVQQVAPMPAGIGRPRLNRGQDGRIYVEGDLGRHVMVVDDAGRSATVTLAGAGAPGPGGSPGATGAPDAPGTPGATDPSTAPGSPDAPDTTGPTATSPTGRPPTSDPTRSSRPPSGSAPESSGPTTAPNTAPTGAPPGEGGDPGPGQDALPATRPTMPARLTATRRADTLVLTWGAAGSNGAAISAYHVAWESAGNPGGSAVQPGDARTMTLTGLTRGATYRITVSAENAVGRGVAATIDATVLPPRSITVSRGATTTHEPDCLPPGCAFILIEMRGFEPNTAYDIDPWGSRWGGTWNPGANLTTDNEGNLTVDDRFPIDTNDQEIWVVVDGMESNHYPWPSGEPS